MKNYLRRSLVKTWDRFLSQAAGIGLDDPGLLAVHGAAATELITLEQNSDKLSEAFVEENLERVTTSIKLLASRLRPGVSVGVLLPVSIVVSTVPEALNAIERGDMEEAIEALATAEFARGALLGETAEPQATKAALLSMLGKKGAAVRHVETRSIREQVDQWCEANSSKYRSIDAAAAAVIEAKLAPIVFTTARKYVREWRKMHSAGKT